jgi:hypothetical protein
MKTCTNSNSLLDSYVWDCPAGVVAARSQNQNEKAYSTPLIHSLSSL